MNIDPKTLELIKQKRKASITDQKILEVMLKHADSNSADRYYAVCHEVLGYTPLGSFIQDFTEINDFEKRYCELERRMGSTDWITGRAFQAEVGKSYRVHFGQVGQGFASAIIRADSPVASGWFDLETGALLAPELAGYVVQAYIHLT